MNVCRRDKISGIGNGNGHSETTTIPARRQEFEKEPKKARKDKLWRGIECLSTLYPSMEKGFYE